MVCDYTKGEVKLPPWQLVETDSSGGPYEVLRGKHDLWEIFLYALLREIDRDPNEGLVHTWPKGSRRPSYSDIQLIKSKFLLGSRQS
jgi:hypothetical protein